MCDASPETGAGLVGLNYNPDVLGSDTAQKEIVSLPAAGLRTYFDD